MDYVDLFLLHHPVPTDFDSTVEAYKALERVLGDGRVRAIGVSNFSESHLESLMGRHGVVPALNQVELHPFFTQPALRAFHRTHAIATQAWSPLGGINVYRPADPNDVRNPLDAPDDRRACREAREDASAGRPALAHRARHLDDPEVGQAAPDRGEHRRLRFLAETGRGRGDRLARHGGPRRPRPRDDRPGSLPVYGRELSNVIPDRRVDAS